MTPQGRLDERCLYDWIEGMAYILAAAVAVVMVGALLWAVL